MKSPTIVSFILSILSVGSVPQFVYAADDCGKFLSSVKVSPPQMTSINLSELMKTNNLDLLSDREKALFAKAHDFLKNHEGQTAAELVTLGLDQAQVVKLLEAVVEQDLEKLEADGPVLKLFRDARNNIEGLLADATRIESLEDFSKRHGLSSERIALSKTSKGKLSSSQPAARTLKAAIMTGDRDLINRSFRQAFKHGLFDELTALAAESNDNFALINLGRLSIARYLFFDRNHNWLSEGLRSLSEVTGAERDEVVAFLYDLHDLLRSPAILANESEVRIYEEPGNLSNYSEDALKVLITSLPIARRMRGDSSAAFSYQYERTNESTYVNRVLSLFRETMAAGQNISFTKGAIIQLGDTQLLLRIARDAEAYSRKVPARLSEREAEIFVAGARSVANAAYVMAANTTELTQYYQRVIFEAKAEKNPRFPFGFSHGDNALLVSDSVVKLFRSFLRNPELISDSVTRRDLEPIVSWLETYDYVLKDSVEYVRPTSKMFYDVNFSHEERSIRYFLEEGEGVSPEEIRKFQSNGRQKLQARDYWYAMGAFISARDLEGLELTYKAIMKDGRPLDAVYVALAMEWIRTGKSPFDKLKAIAKGPNNGPVQRKINF